MILNGGLKYFILSCKGFDRQLSLDIANSWNEGICMYNSIEFTISLEIIIEAIYMPNEGIEVRREAK